MLQACSKHAPSMLQAMLMLCVKISHPLPATYKVPHFVRTKRRLRRRPSTQTSSMNYGATVC